jgi:cystathionine gamma-lyase
LDLGADIVIQSLTKYMNGHSDVVMGAIFTNDEELYSRILALQNSVGAVPSPFDCYLVNRGLKTLSLRMKQHSLNGQIVAEALERNPRIEKVIFPGFYLK